MDAPRAREGGKAMRGDLEITGLTHPHPVDILDVVLVDPDSSSRQNQTIQQILHNTEYKKNHKYHYAARQHRNARFVPLAFTTTGVYGRHATIFFKTLPTLLKASNGKFTTLVMNWVRCRISTDIQRWVNTCIRGSRSLSTTSGSKLSKDDDVIDEVGIPRFHIGLAQRSLFNYNYNLYSPESTFFHSHS